MLDDRDTCKAVTEAAFPEAGDMEGPLHGRGLVSLRPGDLAELIGWCACNPRDAMRLAIRIREDDKT